MAASARRIRESCATPGPGWLGEPGFSVYERTAIRPALDVTAVDGGYAGPGAQGRDPGPRAPPSSTSASCPTRIPRRSTGSVVGSSAALPPQVTVTLRTLLRGPAGLDTARRSRHAFGAAARALGRVRPRAGLPALGRIDPDRRHAAGALRCHPSCSWASRCRRRDARPERGVNLPTFERGTIACARFLELVGAGDGRPELTP